VVARPFGARGLADLVRIERTFREGFEDGLAQEGDLFFGDSELEGGLGFVGERGAGLERQGEIGRGHHVGAVARRGQFVDLEAGDRGIGGFARSPGAGTQREVGRHAAHRARPSGLGQDGGRSSARKASIERLSVPPPGAQFGRKVKLHRPSL